jgi:uncharacterized ion transporter superfamily protein YfcC
MMTSLACQLRNAIPKHFMFLLGLVVAGFAVVSGDFDRVDVNKDGTIDREEFKVIAPAVESFFASISAKVAPAMEDAGFMSAFVNSVVRISLNASS